MIHFNPRHLARPISRARQNGADGTLHHYLLLDWDDSPQEHNGYGVKVTIDGKSSFYKADDSKIRIPVSAPSTGTVQIRARATDGGTPSDWSEELPFTVTKKSGLPTTPTELTIVGKHRRAVVKTEDHPDRDFRRWNFHYATVNNFASATKSRHSRSNRFVVDDLANGQTYYGWLTAEDASGNESAKYPASNTAGVAFTTVKLDDDDTDDATLAAPTWPATPLTKVQDTDEDGAVRTFIRMVCNPPAWATTKTTYVFAVTVGSDTYTIKSDDEVARYRVQKTGALHTVKVRAVKGNGNKGSWSTNQTITPTKKTAAPTTASGLAATAKPKGIRLRWTKCPDSDYAETILYRHTANSFGSASEVDRVKGTTVLDSDELTAGTTYYYWVCHVDRSGNIGAQSSSANATYKAVTDGDTDGTTPGKPAAPTITTGAADVDDDGKQEAILAFAWSLPAGTVTPRSWELEVWRSSTLGGSYSLWREYEVDGDKLSKRISPNTKFFYKARVKGKAFNGRGGTPSDLTATGVQPTKREYSLDSANMSIDYLSYRKKHVVRMLGLFGVPSPLVNDPEFSHFVVEDQTSGDVVYKGRATHFTRHNPPATSGYKLWAYDIYGRPGPIFKLTSPTAPAGGDGVGDVDTVELADNAATGPAVQFNSNTASSSNTIATVSGVATSEVAITLVIGSFKNNTGAQLDVPVTVGTKSYGTVRLADGGVFTGFSFESPASSYTMTQTGGNSLSARSLAAYPFKR
jgi:hypothetical protein